MLIRQRVEVETITIQYDNVETITIQYDNVETITDLLSTRPRQREAPNKQETTPSSSCCRIRKTGKRDADQWKVQQNTTTTTTHTHILIHHTQRETDRQLYIIIEHISTKVSFLRTHPGSCRTEANRELANAPTTRSTTLLLCRVGTDTNRRDSDEQTNCTTKRWCVQYDTSQQNH